MANHNGNGNDKKLNLPDHLRFDRSPVKCQRCKRPFDHFVMEVIDDLVQLRCGSVLIPRTEMVCLNCGCVFYWNVGERNLEKMAGHYRELLGLAKGYAPE